MVNKCACVILNYNDFETTLSLLNEIKEYDSIDHIIIVDNCSSDNSFNEIKKVISNNILSNVKLYRTDHNGGYGYGNNFGIKIAKNKWKSDYVLVANPDVHFDNKVIKEELFLIQSVDDCAAVAPIQLDKDGKIIKDVAWKCPDYLEYTLMDTHFGSKLFNSSYSESFFCGKDYCAVDCLPGSLVLFDADKFTKVGGYDERIFLYCEETTIGLKFKEAGFFSLLDLKNTYIHEHSISVNKTFNNEEKKYKILANSRLKVIRYYLSNNIFLYYLSAIIYKLIIIKKHIKNKI